MTMTRWRRSGLTSAEVVVRSALALVLLVVPAFALFGCTRSETPQKRPAASPPDLHAEFIGLVPVADGGAYATGMARGLWYLREGVGSRVKGVPDDDLLLSRIVAMADGGAFLVVDDGPARGVWYLRGDSARRVEEIGSLRSDGRPVDPASWRWVQRQEEARARKSAEDEAAEVREGDGR